MTGIAIRAYRPEDRDLLIELFRSAVRRVAIRDYTRDQILAWAPDAIDAEAFGRRRASKPTFIATIEGEPVGFTDLESDGHIDMLFVHADHQSKGVARALLDHVERLARSRQMPRLYTEASITARRVFERHGFRVLAQQTVAPGGEALINYRMEKRLARQPGQAGSPQAG